MGFETDIVDETEVEFEIDGREFAYVPTTAGDEIDWLPEYMKKVTKVVDDEVKEVYEQDLGMINECKLRKITKVPYDSETLMNATGKASWDEVPSKEKGKFFRKISPDIYSKIIKKINEIDSKKKV